MEESKHGRISRNLKRSGSSDQSQPKFNKKVSAQYEPGGAKVTLEKGSGSQVGKPICASRWKRHYGECLLGTGSCFGYGKYGHKVRDCPSREGKHVPPNAQKGDAPKKNRIYVLRSRGSKSDEGFVDDGNFLYFFAQCYEFLLSGEVWLVGGLRRHRSMLLVHGV